MEQIQSALELLDRKPAEIITEYLWTELPDHEWIADVGKLKAFVFERESERFPGMKIDIAAQEMDIITLRDEESKSPPIPSYLENNSSHSQVNVVMPQIELPRRTTGDPLIDD